jgi:biopolymer transport protein TolR
MLQTRACPDGAISMAFSMAGGGASRPQINVTPLIDVLLTLIIMFMLVVSMDPEYGEKAQIPQPDQKEPAGQPQPRTIVIQVIWTGRGQLPTVKLNQEDVRWEDLEMRLARIYLTRVEKVAFVRGDADVDFQYVASVIDLAYQAGVQRIGLLTKDQRLRDE